MHCCGGGRWPAWRPPDRRLLPRRPAAALAGVPPMRRMDVYRPAALDLGRMKFSSSADSAAHPDSEAAAESAATPTPLAVATADAVWTVDPPHPQLRRSQRGAVLPVLGPTPLAADRWHQGDEPPLAPMPQEADMWEQYATFLSPPKFQINVPAGFEAQLWCRELVPPDTAA